MRRCLWIEPNSQHEGLLPTWVHVLGNMDITMDAFLPRASLQRHVLFATPHRHCRLHVYHGQLSKPGGFRYQDYDFVILNSLEDLGGAEPRLLLEEIQDIPVPVIMVSHFADLLAVHPMLETVQRNPLRKLLVIAPHVAEQLAEVDNIHAEIFFPVYYGELPLFASRHNRAIFSVQGTVDNSKRHYHSLIDAVSELKKQGFGNFRVQIVGKNSAQDDDLWKEISKRGLRSHLIHPMMTEQYQRYYRTLAASHYLLPLLDESRPEYHRYFTYGASSSIPLALGLGLIPVINKTQAEGWGIEYGSILYDGADLTSGMLKALTITGGALHYRRQQIRESRRFFLQQNALMLSLALRGVPLRFAA